MTFDEIKALPGTQLVMFYSTSCAPCASMKPIMKDMTATAGVELHMVNVASELPTARELGIRAVPTVVALRDGVAETLFAGARPEAEIRKVLEAAGVISG